MQKKKKEKWGKPKLIVLVKGDRQEGVLMACKRSESSSGPSSGDVHCLDGVPCGSCEADTPS